MDPRPSSKTTAPRHRPAAAPGGGGDDDDGTAIPTTAWWMDVLGEWLSPLEVRGPRRAAGGQGALAREGVGARALAAARLVGR